MKNIDENNDCGGTGLVGGSGSGGGSAGNGGDHPPGKKRAAVKPKPLIPDPATLYAAGLRTLSEAMIMVHMGRCGLQGATVRTVCDALATNYNTTYAIFLRLEEMRLITPYTRHNGKGRAERYVITVTGWRLLTTPPELDLFPSATKEVVL